MKRYAAFLRGVNISGKNKLAMAELKTGLEALGLHAVKTYLNSGNAAFSVEELDAAGLAARLQDLLQTQFGLDVPVFVIEQQALADILRHAPGWWGTADRAVYDNLIFVLPPSTPAAVSLALGAPKDGLERVQAYRDAIFWSFDRRDYQKTNWWSKTASAAIGRQLTIRTAGTVRKMAAL